MFEIGRMIAGNAGILVTTRDLREGGRRQDLRHRRRGHERPHPSHPLRGATTTSGRSSSPAPAPARIVADVVGPVCETGDYLALGREMPAVTAGDLLAVMTAGAYGAVQACTYNTRLLVPEVLVRGGESRGRPAAPDLRGCDRPRPAPGLARLSVLCAIDRWSATRPRATFSGQRALTRAVTARLERRLAWRTAQRPQAPIGT